jgi:hypothetical protein
MLLTADDKVAIAETLALHGHLFDRGELDRLDELFTANVHYDLEEVGRESLRGIEAIRRAALDLGDGNPVGHHITNIAITQVDDGGVTTLCKGIGVMSDGSCRSYTYLDLLTRQNGGWRIAYRKIMRHDRPLGRTPPLTGDSQALPGAGQSRS